jgi:bacterial/archaeal transporter family protein
MNQHGWLPAAAGYVLAVGVLGIAAKFALRATDWRALLLSTTAWYIALSSVMLLRGGIRLPPQPGMWILPLLLTGALTAGSFPLLIAALSRGQTSLVVPVTASYPIITAVLSVVVLAEPFNWIRAMGTLLIVVGVALVSIQASSS